MQFKTADSFCNLIDNHFDVMRLSETWFKCNMSCASAITFSTGKSRESFFLAKKTLVRERLSQ